MNRPGTALLSVLLILSSAIDLTAEDAPVQHWLWSKARTIPADASGEGGGVVSIAEDANGRLFLGPTGGSTNSTFFEYDPRSGQWELLKQAVARPTPEEKSPLVFPAGQPVRWAVSPDRKTLYAIAMSENQLLAYDLSDEPVSRTPSGRQLGKLIPEAEQTECFAICVSPGGTVWAGVRGTLASRKAYLHVVSWTPGDAAPTDHGPVAIGNPEYSTFNDAAGKPLPDRDGACLLDDGTLVPRSAMAGICAHSNGSVYFTTSAPLTLHEIRIPRVAGVTTVFRHNSHADVILGRTFLTDTLDGQGEQVQLKLASLYTDQSPPGETSEQWAAQFGFLRTKSIREALTLGTGKLAVDGVVMVAEHGDYPKSPSGQTEYPKRRLFSEIAEVIRESGRPIPIFSDKHLSDNWEDAKWFYDTARELKIPLMAGSSLPVAWREPATDVKRGAKLKQIVGVSYGRLDGYGFHGVEMLQCLAERRAGAETGVKQVRCYLGEDVWQAGDDGVYEPELLNATLARLTIRSWERRQMTVREAVKEPVLFVADYRDGLRTCLFTLNGAVAEWAAAWRYDDAEQTIDSTLFKLQEDRPFGHFSLLLMGVEKLMHTGRPAWPVERTLLTSGILDAALRSHSRNGESILTPWLDVNYQSDWNWRQPPPPPLGRSLREQ